MLEDLESEFPPKIYDSHDPKASVVCHYHLWRDFEDNSVADGIQQHQQQSKLGSEFDLYSNSTHEDTIGSSISVGENSNTTTETHSNLSNSDSSSTGDPTTRAINQRLDKTLDQYLNEWDNNSVARERSATRFPITKEEICLKNFSDYSTPVCNVTISDFTPKMKPGINLMSPGLVLLVP
ncbi:unnamed protein product [Ambrosiozyma monospora]|uniref:Unnamed protein product n=1 Tax=Ambrosiozyma monospora TaxID=43982 RepID=A0ACB5U8V7_AMBMO|nr:unnamed protein product [Ambrosiozyma monospora]